MKKYLFGFIASILFANYLTTWFGLVPIGFGATVTAGTFAAGAALVLRDMLHVHGNSRIVLAAIASGAVLSYTVASPMIALASGVAFLFSELVDFAVFTPLRKNMPLAVLASSIAGAPVDTVLFLHVSGFGVTWQAVIGQFIVKTLLALSVIPLVKRIK